MTAAYEAGGVNIMVFAERWLCCRFYSIEARRFTAISFVLALLVAGGVVQQLALQASQLSPRQVSP